MSICFNYPTTIPLMLKSKPGYDQGHLSSPERDFEITGEDESWLLCRNCQAQITSRAQEISIANNHLHTLTNPIGLVFKIGCFASASGCLFHGEATNLHSWFAGYAWNYADCANCHHHLGWQFVNQKTTHSFSGLILDRLTNGS